MTIKYHTVQRFSRPRWLPLSTSELAASDCAYLIRLTDLLHMFSSAIVVDRSPTF